MIPCVNLSLHNGHPGYFCSEGLLCETVCGHTGIGHIPILVVTAAIFMTIRAVTSNYENHLSETQSLAACQLSSPLSRSLRVALLKRPHYVASRRPGQKLMILLCREASHTAFFSSQMSVEDLSQKAIEDFPNYFEGSIFSCLNKYS